MSDTENTGDASAPFIASGALEVLDAYRALGNRERGRVYAFAHDALMRQQYPQAAATYASMEAFQAFVDASLTGETAEVTCHGLDLTPDQYERLRAAWLAVQAVHEEGEAACFEPDGPGGELAR